MKKEHLKYLVCPKDRSPLSLSNEETSKEGEILSGILTSEKNSNTYPIKEGVADFFEQKQGREQDTINMFGDEWQHYNNWGWIEELPDEKDAEMKYQGGLSDHGEDSFIKKAPFIDGDLDPNTTVALDAGCGNGRHARVSSTMVKLLFCADASVAIYEARKNLTRIGRKNVCCIRADIFNLPFADNTLDAAYSIGVMQHTGSAKKFFASLSRITKKGKAFTVNCYGTGLIPYEIIDWSSRAIITRLSSKKQMWVSSKIAAFDRFLRRKGKFANTIRKLITVNFQMHCADCIVYDWYSPKLAHHYKPTDIKLLAYENDGYITHAVPDFTKDDYSDWKRMLFHDAMQFRVLKKA